MTTRTRRSPRRKEALSSDRIVETAIELLDTVGEDGLTFRALTERLATGPGAIYYHVANKGELLSAATDAVVAAALARKSAEPMEPAEPADTPWDGMHTVALGLYDAIGQHPWLATQLSTQLSRSPWGPVAPRIFESVGRQVRALGVPEDNWFTVGSTLMHYILGAAGQNAANTASASTRGPDTDRAQFLDAVAAAWEQLDPDDYPITRAVAAQTRGHDDREQFLAGIDLILAGITTTLHPPGDATDASPATAT